MLLVGVDWHAVVEIVKKKKRVLAIVGGSCHKYNFCRDKSVVATNMCLSRQNPSFVATNIILSRQAYFCRDKHMFVATKMILVAAPANDNIVTQINQ